MPASHCELVIWRDGVRRCELWTIDGREWLRVFEGDSVMFEERTFLKSSQVRGMALRHLPLEEHARLVRRSAELASEAERLLALPYDVEATQRHHVEVADHRAAIHRHLDAITARAQTRSTNG